MGNYYKVTNELIERAKQGDKQAEEEIIINNMNYIKYIVNKNYTDINHETKQDLYQESVFGVLDAIRCFDPSKGMQFSSYLQIRIIQKCNRYLDKDNAVKIPISLKQKLVKYKKMVKKGATKEEIIKEIKMHPEELNNLGTTVQPLNYIDAMQSTKITNFMEDDYFESIESDILYKCLNELDPEERSIIALKFGLINGETNTNHSICRKTGIKKKEIDEIANDAIIKLRNLMEKYSN